MQICLSFKWTGLHFKQWNKIVCVCLFLSGREWCLLHGVIMQSEWINPRETWPVGDGEFPSPKKQPINDRSCKESELSISISLPLLPESHKPVGRAWWPPVAWALSLEGRWSCRSVHYGWGHFWWSLMLLLLPRWQFYTWALEVWGKLSSLCSALSNSLWPNGLKPTRLLYPQVFLGKNTGVGCHFFLHLSLSTRVINCIH